MKKRKMKNLVKGLLILLALVMGVLIFASNYLIHYALARKGEDAPNVAPTSAVSEENQSLIDSNKEMIRQKKDLWLSQTTREEAEILSEDGLKLKGEIFWAEDTSSHRWLLAIHGYNGQRSGMQEIACYYAEKGYHVLTPDMRAHGESEGEYIGMGWLDRKDVLQWIQYIISLDSEAEIILHGVSMGGATVMMVSGETLPENVKGIVEDCGYTSVWDIFSDELSYLFHLPEFPILYMAEAFAQLRVGYGFHEASSVEQVAKCQLPMLFIHGSEDNFVHTEMVYEVYEACTTPKELLIVEGAGHGNSYSMDPELYFDTVFRFLETYCE